MAKPQVSAEQARHALNGLCEFVASSRAEVIETYVEQLEAKLEEAERWGTSEGAYTKQELERMYNLTLTREVELHAQLAVAKAKLGEERDRALEDAARFVEGYEPDGGTHLGTILQANVAPALRAMKGSKA